MDVVHQGGCLCGAVRYRITRESVARTLCHCRSCRLASGAPSLAWTVVHAGDLHHDGGLPTEFESSPGIFRGFCARCGTSLTWRSAAKPATIDVTTASLDAPDAFGPTKEIWVEHRLAWEAPNPTLPQYLRSSVGAEPIAPGSS